MNENSQLFIINKDIFKNAIKAIEELINEHHSDISLDDRVEAYFEAYEYKILNHK